LPPAGERAGEDFNFAAVVVESFDPPLTGRPAILEYLCSLGHVATYAEFTPRRFRLGKTWLGSPILFGAGRVAPNASRRHPL
jgi:hypothetical protein